MINFSSKFCQHVVQHYSFLLKSALSCLDLDRTLEHPLSGNGVSCYNGRKHKIYIHMQESDNGLSLEHDRNFTTFSANCFYYMLLCISLARVYNGTKF